MNEKSVTFERGRVTINAPVPLWIPVLSGLLGYIWGLLMGFGIWG